MSQSSPRCAVALMMTLSLSGFARADQKGEALLAQVEKAMQAAQTLTADLTETMRLGRDETKTSWKVQLKKPNLARMTLKEPSSISVIKAILSDGKMRWETVENNRYTRRPADPKGRKLLYGHEAAQFFFEIRDTLTDLHSLKPRYAGQERVGDTPCDVLEFAGDSETEPSLKDPGTSETMEFRLKLYITPEKRITRLVTDIGPKGKKEQGMHQEAILTHARWNVPIPASLFAYKPAKNARPYEAPQIKKP